MFVCARSDEGSGGKRRLYGFSVAKRGERERKWMVVDRGFSALGSTGGGILKGCKRRRIIYFLEFWTALLMGLMASCELIAVCNCLWFRNEILCLHVV